MIDLRGKPIAITGASSGIGRAAAIACARAGMPVALGARRVDKLESVVGEIKAADGRAIAVPTDVTRPEDCRALIDRTIAEFGAIYAVFANAGYGLERPTHLTTDAELRAIFETNFFGTMNTVRPALEVMLRQRQGHVLICSSCLAKVGTPFVSAYSATKAAQDHIARALRAELRGMGVEVSSVHPIGTETEFFEAQKDKSGPVALSRPAAFMMQSADVVGRAVVNRLRSGRGGETWTRFGAPFAFAMLNAFPWLGDWALSRYARQQTERAATGAPPASGP
jgi:uncharacterized protein